MFAQLSLAQKVRLWFILGCQVLSFVLLIVAINDLNFSPYLDVTVAAGNTVGVVAWVLISQVAVVTLAIITGYRFFNPKTPHVCTGGDDGSTHH
jgi:hypothetical protein